MSPILLQGFVDQYADEVIGDGTGISRDMQLIQANFRSPSNLDATDTNDIVDLYFDPPFAESPKIWGDAYNGFLVNYNGYDAKYRNQAHVSLTAVRDSVVVSAAHEIMHLLTNASDPDKELPPTPGEIFFPTNAAVEQFGMTAELGRRMSLDTKLKALSGSTLLQLIQP